MSGWQALFSWGAAERRRRHAAELYREAVTRARRPELYATLGVPDTVEGRFEMIAWQVLVMLERLRRAPAGDDPALRQALVDLHFADLDRSLRELGVADLKVGKEMRKLGEAWQARTRLAAIVFPADDAPTLASFLARNLDPAADWPTTPDHLAIAKTILGGLREPWAA